MKCITYNALKCATCKWNRRKIFKPNVKFEYFYEFEKWFSRYQPKTSLDISFSLSLFLSLYILLNVLTGKLIFAVRCAWRIQSIHCTPKCHSVCPNWCHHKPRISVQDVETCDYRSQVTSNGRCSLSNWRRHCCSLSYSAVPTAPMAKGDCLLANSIQLVTMSDDRLRFWKIIQIR